MTYRLIYEEPFTRSLRTVWDQDPQAVKRVLAALRDLAHEPRPDNASRLGEGNLYRLHVDEYRVIYEVRDDEVAVLVIQIGRRSQR